MIAALEYGVAGQPRMSDALDPAGKELPGRMGDPLVPQSGDGLIVDRYRIFWRHGAWYVDACGSRAATRLNGSLVRTPQVLCHGDEIVCGAALVKFVCLDHVGAAPPPRSAVEPGEPTPPILQAAWASERERLQARGREQEAEMRRLRVELAGLRGQLMTLKTTAEITTQIQRDLALTQAELEHERQLSVAHERQLEAQCLVFSQRAAAAVAEQARMQVRLDEMVATNVQSSRGVHEREQVCRQQQLLIEDLRQVIDGQLKGFERLESQLAQRSKHTEELQAELQSIRAQLEARDNAVRAASEQLARAADELRARHQTSQTLAKQVELGRQQILYLRQSLGELEQQLRSLTLGPNEPAAAYPSARTAWPFPEETLKKIKQFCEQLLLVLVSPA